MRVTTHAVRGSVAMAVVLGFLLTASGDEVERDDGSPTAVAFDPSSLQVERTVLPNGLTVLLHEDKTIPSVTLWQWYKVGSRDERPGITGISHYCEHMMFNGSAHVAPKEYDRILESNGGYSNAFTDRDMTAYYEDIASDRLDVLFELDSDRMASLSLAPDQLQSEIGVVQEERRLSTDNSIIGLLDEQLYAVAFNASPYRWPVIGWMGDLQRIERQDVVDYYRTYYAPNNCILVLTGDFDSGQAIARIRAKFGEIPSRTPPPSPPNSEPEQRGERRAEVHYPAQNVTVMVGFKAPSATHADAPALDLLEAILGEGESSRLHRSLVYEKQLALAVTANFAERIDPGLFEFVVELKPGQPALAGEQALDETLDQLKKEGPTERELRKAKNQLAADFIRRLKTNNGVGQQIGYYEHVFGDYRAIFQVLPKQQSVTVEDCRRVANRYFDPAQRTVVSVAPSENTP